MLPNAFIPLLKLKAPSAPLIILFVIVAVVSVSVIPVPNANSAFVIASAPFPNAPLFDAVNVPPVNTVPPVYVFAPVIVVVPLFVNPALPANVVEIVFPGPLIVIPLFVNVPPLINPPFNVTTP